MGNTWIYGDIHILRKTKRGEEKSSLDMRKKLCNKIKLNHLRRCLHTGSVSCIPKKLILCSYLKECSII